MKKVLMLVMVLCLGFSLTGAVNAEYTIGFEAEEGVNGSDLITAPFETIIDPMASGGLAVGTDESVGDSNNNVPADGRGSKTFWAPAGRYYVLGRFRSDTSDSFWVRITDSSGNSVNDNVNNNANEPDWVRYNNIHMPSGESRVADYRWDVVHSDDHGERQARFDLPEDGFYTLEWARREDGVYVDGWVITSALGIDQRLMPDFIPGAEGPATVPADGATAVPLNTTTLSWDAVDGATYDVSLGTNPAFLTKVGTVVASGDTASFDLTTVFPFGLPPNTTYYWQLDQDGKYLDVMSFTTFSTQPVIVSQPPALINLGADCTATLEVVAKSGDDDAGPALSYQWSDSTGEIPGATSPTYVTDVPETYTCTITTGDPNDAKTTDPAVVAAPPHLDFLGSFSNADINDPGLAGRVEHVPDSGQITVIGGGNDIWDSADKFHFAYVEHSGDGEWIAVQPQQQQGHGRLGQGRHHGTPGPDGRFTELLHAYCLAKRRDLPAARRRRRRLRQYT